MTNEREAVIEIGGKPYALLLTTRATKEIAARYGGLDTLGDKLMKSENFEQALDEIVWLITLLANQAILVHNLREQASPQPLLKEEDVELMTTPYGLAAYRDAITECMLKGTKRNVLSEEETKNAPTG